MKKLILLLFVCALVFSSCDTEPQCDCLDVDAYEFEDVFDYMYDEDSGRLSRINIKKGNYNYVIQEDGHTKKPVLIEGSADSEKDPDYYYTLDYDENGNLQFLNLHTGENPISDIRRQDEYIYQNNLLLRIEMTDDPNFEDSPYCVKEFDFQGLTLNQKQIITDAPYGGGPPWGLHLTSDVYVFWYKEYLDNGLDSSDHLPVYPDLGSFYLNYSYDDNDKLIEKQAFDLESSEAIGSVTVEEVSDVQIDHHYSLLDDNGTSVEAGTLHHVFNDDGYLTRKYVDDKVEQGMFFTYDEQGRLIKKRHKGIAGIRYVPWSRMNPFIEGSIPLEYDNFK